MTLVPGKIIVPLSRISQGLHDTLYLAGGAVRDLLTGTESRDFDFVCNDPFACARQLSTILHGAFVPLDKENGIARVVVGPMIIDFSQYRGTPGSIEEDLWLRDFTINAMALPLSALILPEATSLESILVDPTGGRQDFADGIVRAVSDQVFLADPLRLLRAYRFAASLDLQLDPHTEKLINRHQGNISLSAAERLRYELDLIFDTPRSALAVQQMADVGLLWLLFPELARGRAMLQPASHHLDVWQHTLETLRQMEVLSIHPEEFFADRGASVADYLAQGHRRRLLKWAALFHDLGKPGTLCTETGRITFHNHDRRGADLFVTIARRLKWSHEAIKPVSLLIGEHMRPFHLANVGRKDGRVTPRACLRLVRNIGEHLVGLFCLAMADSLAGQGPEKPPGMEAELLQLFFEIMQVYEEHVAQVLAQPPLLSGHDLIKEFSLRPGPIFKDLLLLLQEAQAEGEVHDRAGAMAYIQDFLTRRQGDNRKKV